MTSKPLTVTIEQAARDLGAPKVFVRRLAEDLGLLIHYGSRKRIDPNDYQEILDACRNTPRVPVCTVAKTQVSTLSETQGAASVQRALETAEKLKRHSQTTSQNEKGQLVPLSRGKC